MKKKGRESPDNQSRIVFNTALQNSQNDREIPAFAGMEKRGGNGKKERE